MPLLGNLDVEEVFQNTFVDSILPVFDITADVRALGTSAMLQLQVALGFAYDDLVLSTPERIGSSLEFAREFPLVPVGLVRIVSECCVEMTCDEEGVHTERLVRIVTMRRIHEGMAITD